VRAAPRPDYPFSDPTCRNTMQFRSSGQRDQRRRLVTIDDLTTRSTRTTSRKATDKDKSEPVQSTRRTYSTAAVADRQHRVTDLIPKRLESFALIFLIGLTAIAALAYLYSRIEPWSGVLGRDRLAAFDLAGPASLSVWFSSFMLAICAVTCELIYTIRRHKKDDFQGRYRVWRWAAVVWLFGSICAVAPLHKVTAGVLAVRLGTPLLADGSLWWILACAAVMTPLIALLLLDLRHCPTAAVAISTAVVCYLFAGVVSLGWITAGETMPDVMIGSIAKMLSQLLLLTSLGLYGRHVFLDAQGRLPLRAGTRRGALKVVSDDLGDVEPATEQPDEKKTYYRVDPPHDTAPVAPSTKKSTAKKTKTAKSKARPLESKIAESNARRSDRRPDTLPVSQAVHPDLADELERLESLEEHHLTKAQRRRLRKLRRRHQRMAG